jgi:hypothetical protein
MALQKQRRIIKNRNNETNPSYQREIMEREITDYK